MVNYLAIVSFSSYCISLYHNWIVKKYWRPSRFAHGPLRLTWIQANSSSTPSTTPLSDLVTQVQLLLHHVTTLSAEEKWQIPFESFSLSNFISVSSWFKFTLSLIIGLLNLFVSRNNGYIHHVCWFYTSTNQFTFAYIS